jgi:carbamoyl-phosphate synthase small subunit
VRSRPPALLALEDGTTVSGLGFGASGEAFGEGVFNTAMSGYQEVLTDPSYAGQVVVMTSPHQGNYGANPDDPESGSIRVAGFAVREASRRASNWRSRTTLAAELEAGDVVGIEGIDTRRITVRLRSHGAMRCAISTEDLDPGSLVERVRTAPGMAGADLARTVSTARPYEAIDVVGPPSTALGPVFRVAAYDFGLKRNILRLMVAGGCEVTVFPAQTPPSRVLSDGFDGAFLSNGPGDPSATTYGIDAARGLLGEIPLFGICLGHQLLGVALSGSTYKMKFGHRGANQPVRDLRTGRVEVTSHNHGFAVDPGGWGTRSRDDGADPPVVKTPFGRVALTHWNLNDGTLEGMRCLDVPAFSVQYHPEAAPGPHDARHLFDDFRDAMAHA